MAATHPFPFPVAFPFHFNVRMKKTLLPALILAFAISGFALIFCTKEEPPIPRHPPANAKAASEGRPGQGTAPDRPRTPKTKERLKLSGPETLTLTPEQQAAEQLRLARIAGARATFDTAVAANDEAAIASRDFLAANGQRKGVITTDSGLQYEIVANGTGPVPAATDKVNVHYHGTLPDGTVFDSSVDRGAPVTFPLSGVIAGWTEGLQLMPAGSTVKLFIPPWLAYGATGTPPKIARHAALVFEVQLLAIEQN